MAVEGEFPKVDGDILYASETNTMFNMCPVGSIFAWLKSYTNTPALPSNWVECNGQTLSDADSVYNGQVIPDLNGGARFLYGAASSGGTKSEDFIPAHDHDFTYYNSGATTSLTAVGSATNATNTTWVQSVTSGTALAGYAVVWIIRVK